MGVRVGAGVSVGVFFVHGQTGKSVGAVCVGGCGSLRCVE